MNRGPRLPPAPYAPFLMPGGMRNGTRDPRERRDHRDPRNHPAAEPKPIQPLTPDSYDLTLEHKVSLTALLQSAYKMASKQGPGEVSFSCIDDIMVLRIGGRGAGRFQTELMVPTSRTGKALLTSYAPKLTPEQEQLKKEIEELGKKPPHNKQPTSSSEKKDDVKDNMTPEEVQEALMEMGVDVFLPPALPETDDDKEAFIKKLWDSVAGYDETKAAAKQSITLPLVHFDLFQKMGVLTRGDTSGKVSGGCLFTGPPGVGKTTIAKICAKVSGKPLVYVPVEGVMSKWYGEAEQRLKKVFDLTRKLHRSILFLDELDAFAGSRDGGDMHEATRRILSVLLRNLDGMECVTEKKPKTEGQENSEVVEDTSDSAPFIVTIGATNRPEDLDAALLSRFDQSIAFPLPKDFERAAIFKRYAATLTEEERCDLAAASEGFSGRDIVECCRQAERRWLSKLLADAGVVAPAQNELTAPPVHVYLEAAQNRAVQLKQQTSCGKHV